jgi:integrase
VSVAFARVCRNLEMVDFRFRDLRHTAASWLRTSGADIHTAAQLLGHKDLRMAARYQHLSPAFLQEAVGKLDAVFGSLNAENLEERRRDATAQKALSGGTAVSD